MKNRIYLNNDWEFSPEFEEAMLNPKCKSKFETVRIPHSVVQMPYNNFDESIYQKVSIYRRKLVTDKMFSNKKVLLTIGAAAHCSKVYLNGTELGSHNCGYTAYTVDLTDSLLPEGKENLLCVVVDSRESLDVPPFGHVVDYMTYGGIYRDVYIDIKNPVYIDDVYVKTKSNHFDTEITLNTEEGTDEYTILQRVESVGENPVVSAKINTGVPGKKILTSATAVPVVAWSCDNPVLYNLVTELVNPKGKVVDSNVVRFGFRDIRFDETGFYLNGTKIKLRGLNRHQSYPYVGYAMPKNMQIEDADILKFELGLNYVRTSHYPQSHDFIGRCDELGLLVFTEIPGWQHIGGKEWQDVAVNNVKDMVLQYRNHPSIFMWGVRINESLDNDEFYSRTNISARELDSTRPTAGVRFLKKSNLLEDVYTFNDFSFYGTNEGTLPKSEVTDTNKGYLISEYNGHMFPTKSFDNESHRTEHAIRHATVLDSVAGRDEIAGASGWCAFDYNTHKDFGSGDRICYHGVMDMFRNPKLASTVYKCLGDHKDVGDVLDVTSSMDIGEYPGGSQGDVWILTNADYVNLYVNDVFIKKYDHSMSPFKNIMRGPILIDDYIGNRLVEEDNIPAKFSDRVKEILQALRSYGLDKLPKKYVLKGIPLILNRVATVESMRVLYGKYIGNWGGEKICYRFEAFKNEKLVKVVTKTACGNAALKASVSRSELVEETTYDVTEIHISAVDEHGNVQPYCQEAVGVRTEGAVELIGPSAVSLKGGMCGVYVKSTGKAGKGSVVLTDWYGNETKVPLSVKVKK